jgi:hypothetical protein
MGVKMWHEMAILELYSFVEPIRSVVIEPDQDLSYHSVELVVCWR